MTKKLTQLNQDLALIIDKPVLKALGFDQDTELRLFVIEDSLVIKARSQNDSTAKKKEAPFAESEKKIMKEYEPVLKKLAKT